MERHPRNADVVTVFNAEALESRFGSWPSFHDAEILALRLDSGQRSDGRVRLELDIHLFTSEGNLPDGRFNSVLHTVATLEFTDLADVELDRFGPQNVLFDLELHDLGTTSPTGARMQVELVSSNGLTGAFHCAEAAVIAVEPHTPGPPSVYGRSD